MEHRCGGTWEDSKLCVCVGWGPAQLMEHLPSLQIALGSIPNNSQSRTVGTHL